jgi:two-component system, NarL family, sensor kinase
MPATLRDAVEGVKAILWQAGARTRDFYWVSHHAEDILGYPVAQWLTEPGFWANHIHPEDRDRAVTTCMRAAASGEDHQFQYRAIASDGRILWIQDIVCVVRDEEGGQSELWGVMVDITERKRAAEALHDDESKKAQQALLENETRWQLLCEESGTAILTVDTASRILTANPAAQQLFGYNEQELRQLTTLQLTHEDDRERTRRVVRELIAGRKNVHRYEKRYRRKDGRTVWVTTTGTLVRDARGEPWFFTLMVEDITQRKRSEAALARLSERLRRLQDEERKRLAHELHDSTAQSLAALSLNLGVVETSAGQLNLPAQRALRDAISLASQSAREVRTFAYLLHPPELEELGLASALTTYVEGFAQRSGIHVDLDMTRKIKSLPRDFEINLFRIVQESLANIQRLSGSKTAQIRVIQRPKELFLEVKDQGRGRERSTSRADSSPAGIVIAGMKERARQLGGSLEILRRKTGTTVKVTLPLPQRKAGEGA